MLTRIARSAAQIAARHRSISGRSACRIKFLDTYRRPEYQVTRYANERLGRLADRRYLKEKRRCSVVDFLVGPAGVDPVGVDLDSAARALVDRALADTVSVDPVSVGTVLVGPVSVGPANES
jgi:hypothetical protein